MCPAGFIRQSSDLSEKMGFSGKTILSKEILPAEDDLALSRFDSASLISISGVFL